MIKNLRLKMNLQAIRNLYWKKELSQREIAERINVDQSTICKFMKKHAIPARHYGFTPWNKGKHGIFSKETLHRISKASTRKINLKPTRELGYFCGLIIGDGFIHFNRISRNYEIRMQSTKKKYSKYIS